VPEFDFALGSLFEARRYACNWRDYESMQSAVCDGVRAGRNVDRPFSFLSVCDSATLQRQCAAAHAKYLCPRPLPPLWCGERYDHPRIRVAYVSADFRAHVVMELMAPIFEAHDRARFELIGVSLAADDHSEVLNRARAALDRFIDASLLDDAAAAQAIRAAEADIVVDLTGYTAGCRAAIFARRPAPVRVGYLGFAGTCAADCVDYLIADRTTVPATLEHAYSERIVRLAGSCLPTDDWQPLAAPPPARAELGLPEQAFVFCAFNNTYKFNPTMFAVWMRLLREVPGSVLWLREAGPAVRVHLEREAAACAVDPGRLVFAARIPSKADHMARQARADLFLDTFPYGAHATARDALWAGLPVLTLVGESFASRVAASLLTSLGLPELVTASLLDYEVRALELAQGPARLQSIRSRLAEALRDGASGRAARHCAKLEAAYRWMWSRAQRGERPAAVDF
jgi:predicted O-linked N-acetylglucosamine transferase (SPINDLY family)